MHELKNKLEERMKQKEMASKEKSPILFIPAFTHENNNNNVQELNVFLVDALTILRSIGC